jgi:hypothetical protein
VDPKVLVVRDQFALRTLSNQALSRVLPTYEQATERILAELKTLPAGQLERQLRLQQTLAQIQTQVEVVSGQIAQVLPPAQAEAFIQGLEQADTYLRAVGATPVAAATVEGVTASVGGVAITQQQLVAIARDTGFRTFPGLIRAASNQPYTIGTATARFKAAQTKLIEARLREGFLLSKSTSEIVSDVRVAMGTANRRQVEALVRTSMAEASQTAHDAFNQANEDVLGDKDGNRYVWDASNDGRLCPICAPYDGKRYKKRKQAPWPAHWNERCRILPVTPLTDELDALPETFLEQIPVQYDEKGRRLKPPTGWGGPNAYKQPMKIDGKQHWVRRRDSKGATAGHMLQAANDQTALGVLGTKARLARFRKLTGPKGKFAKDPQGAIVELLRPGGVKTKPAPKLKPPTKPKPKPKLKPPAPPVAPPLTPPAPVAPPPAQAPPVAAPAPRRARRPPAPPPAPTPAPQLYSEVRARANDATTTDIKHKYRTKHRRIVKGWTGSQYTPIRIAQVKAAQARGLDLTDFAKDMTKRPMSPGAMADLLQDADDLEDFISSAPIYKGGKTYRGMRYHSKEAFEEDIRRMRNQEASITLESWTTEESVTYRFNALDRRDRYSVTYVVEDNLHGVPIQSMSQFDDEMEVLMPAGVRYEVVSIEEGASPVASRYGYTPKAQGAFTRVVLRQVPVAPPAP